VHFPDTSGEYDFRDDNQKMAMKSNVVRFIGDFDLDAAKRSSMVCVKKIIKDRKYYFDPCYFGKI